MKKRLVLVSYIPFQRYLGCYEEAFETGAVLGHAFRSNPLVLAKLFSIPGNEQELISYMQQLAAERIQAVGRVQSFFALAMFAEEARIVANWREAGIKEIQQEQLKRRMKMEPKQAFQNLHVAISIGIGFGSGFPEETEKLWSEVYERRIEPLQWQKWRQAGLSLPAEIPASLPLSKRQEHLLSMLHSFVARYRPELTYDFVAYP